MVIPHPLRRLVLAVSAATVSATLIALTPAAADTPTYRATITRTEHDIPHIVAEDWGSLGFGSGYAAAETSICTPVMRSRLPSSPKTCAPRHCIHT